jgi:hypothetical protein
MNLNLFKAFVSALTEEWNQPQGNSSGTQTAMRSERKKIDQQIEWLIDVIADGTPPAVVNKRLVELEARQIILDA